MSLDANLLKMTENNPQEEISEIPSNLAPDASSSNSNIKKAFITGRKAAERGSSRPTEELLKTKYQYTQTQIETYLKAFDEKAGTFEEQQIRKAKVAGEARAKKGYSRPTEKELQGKGYSSAQIEAYLKRYDSKAGSLAEYQINKAKTAGAHASYSHCSRPTIDVLLKRNKYTLEQADAYLKAYDEAKIKKLFKIKKQQNTILSDELSNSKEMNLSSNNKRQKTDQSQDVAMGAPILDDLTNLLLQQYDEVNPFWVEMDSYTNNVKNNLNNSDFFNLVNDFSNESAAVVPVQQDHDIVNVLNLLKTDEDINSFWKEMELFDNNDKNNINNSLESTLASTQKHHNIINDNQYDAAPTPYLGSKAKKSFGF